MKTLLTTLSTHCYAESIIMKCPTMDEDAPPKIYKYEIKNSRAQIMERHDAAWREWCQRRNYVFKKEQGWGDEVSILKTSVRGASCVSMVPLVPKFNDFEANLYQGISYMAQFETVIDFQFLTRTVKQKFERISPGMKPNEIDDQYYDCTAVE